MLIEKDILSKSIYQKMCIQRSTMIILYIYIYIYPQTRISSFPGLISVARLNEQSTTDVTRVLKTPGAEICQNTCGERTKNILFSSVFSRVLNE